MVVAKFAKQDRVQAVATLFDGDDDADDNGLTHSQRLLANGLGTLCYGTITTQEIRRRAPCYGRLHPAHAISDGG